MLHIVNKSPFERSSFYSCLQHTKPDDVVLLIEDAVVAVVKETASANALQDAIANRVAVYVLSPDLSARGLDRKPLVDRVQQVDYEGFVTLTAQNAKLQSWL